MKLPNLLVLILLPLICIPFIALAATHPCVSTLENYVKLRDSDDSKAYAKLFTESATFTIPGLNIAIAGAEQIEQRHASAVMNFKTQHMLTDVKLSSTEDPERIHAESRFILIQQTKGADNRDKTMFSGKYVDELKLFKGKCFFEKRVVEIINRDTWS